MVWGRRTLREQYAPYLVSLFAYTGNVEVELAHEFFSGGAPPAYCWWCITMVYVEILRYSYSTSAREENPTAFCRYLLAQIKKAISHFMPNRNTNWVVETSTGNPTRYVQVNDVIRQVRLAEVRRLGVASNVKRDLKRHEYHLTLRLSIAHCCERVRFTMHVMMKLQNYLIGGTDDL